MSKLFRPTFAQRGFHLCKALFMASGLTLGLVAASAVAAQPSTSPLKGGVDQSYIVVGITQFNADTYDVKLKNPRTGYVHSVTIYVDIVISLNLKIGDRVRERREGGQVVLTREGGTTTQQTPSPPQPPQTPAPSEPEGWRTETYPQYQQIPMAPPQQVTRRYPSGTVRGKVSWDVTVLENNQRVHRKGSCQFDLQFDANGSAYANKLDWRNEDTTSPFPDRRDVETTVTLQRSTSGSFPGQLRVVPEPAGGSFWLYFVNPQIEVQTTKKTFSTTWNTHEESYPTPGWANCAVDKIRIPGPSGHLGPMVIQNLGFGTLSKQVPKATAEIWWNYTL